MPFPLTLQRAGINQTDELGEECLEESEKAIGPLRKEAVAGFDRPLLIYFLIPMPYPLMPNATKKFPFLSFFFFFPLFLSSLGSLTLDLRMQEILPLRAVVSQKFLAPVHPSIHPSRVNSLALYYVGRLLIC